MAEMDNTGIEWRKIQARKWQKIDKYEQRRGKKLSEKTGKKHGCRESMAQEGQVS